MGYLKSIVFGVTLALSLGCTNEPSFGRLVRQAELRWYDAVCRTPRYRTIVTVPKITICGRADPSLNIYGCYDAASGQITLSGTIPRDKLLQVLTHEMGHSLAPGKHVPVNQGIMSEAVTIATPYITNADIAMICEEYDCPCQRPEKP